MTPMDADDRHHWTLITTPVGAEWSGRTRYAAAMHFYETGEMSADVLEVYRVCSRIDAEDPLTVLRRYGFGEAWIAAIERHGCAQD